MLLEGNFFRLLCGWCFRHFSLWWFVATIVLLAKFVSVFARFNQSGWGAKGEERGKRGGREEVAAMAGAITVYEVLRAMQGAHGFAQERVQHVLSGLHGWRSLFSMPLWCPPWPPLYSGFTINPLLWSLCLRNSMHARCLWKLLKNYILLISAVIPLLLVQLIFFLVVEGLNTAAISWFFLKK